MSEADEDLSDDEQEEPMDTTPASTVAQLTIFDQQTGPTKEVPSTGCVADFLNYFSLITSSTK